MVCRSGRVLYAPCRAAGPGPGWLGPSLPFGGGLRCRFQVRQGLDFLYIPPRPRGASLPAGAVFSESFLAEPPAAASVGCHGRVAIRHPGSGLSSDCRACCSSRACCLRARAAHRRWLATG